MWRRKKTPLRILSLRQSVKCFKRLSRSLEWSPNRCIYRPREQLEKFQVVSRSYNLKKCGKTLAAGPFLTRLTFVEHRRSIWEFWVQLISNGLETLGNPSWRHSSTLRKISPSFDFCQLVKCEFQPPCMVTFALNWILVQMVSNCFDTMGNLYGTCYWASRRLLPWFDLQKWVTMGPSFTCPTNPILDYFGLDLGPNCFKTLGEHLYKLFMEFGVDFV